MTENQHNAIKEFQEIRNIRNEKYMIFVKTITTIAVGFLGILLSLADTEKMSCIKHLFYSLLTSTTALGILCSLIVLYGEIASLTILMNNHHNKLLKQVEEGSDNKTFSEADPKGYMIAHYFCLFFFVCSLVCAILYSWF